MGERIVKKNDLLNIIDELAEKRTLSDDGFLFLLNQIKEAGNEEENYLYFKADQIRQQIYGNEVYIRGLIEFSNYCKNDCFYCGIRKSNKNVSRYRLSESEILECCKKGYELGYRTFVLQSGEDLYFDDEKICFLVNKIKDDYPDCAVTLSIGEKSYDSYKKYFEAGADRYLLRHESADFCHYNRLHPEGLSAENRQRCLFDLKEIGYQVGCGIMVGSPFQNNECILKDLRFMEKLGPHMIGIGPFIPQKDTPFGEMEQGSVRDTLHLLSILRLMFPNILLPATTALGTADPLGREKGLKAGANVIMPNLSPVEVRDKYSLYDGKICTGEEAAECRSCIEGRVEMAGYRLVVDRGDYKN